MNDTQKHKLLGWLNSAHAMESGLVEVLERQVKLAETEGEPEVAARIADHLEETRRHCDLVMARIKDLGGEVSRAKEVLAEAKGAVSSMIKSFADDALVAAAIESYAAEHMEIAVYESLAAAAEILEDQETVEMCNEIIQEEELMAEWLREQLPVATRLYVAELE